MTKRHASLGGTLGTVTLRTLASGEWAFDDAPVTRAHRA
jgi:hypothetical protein